MKKIGDKYNDSFRKRDTGFKWERHGKLWLQTEKENLEYYFRQGRTLEEMCNLLQRPAEGVLNQLLKRRLLKHKVPGWSYDYVYAVDVPETEMEGALRYLYSQNSKISFFRETEFRKSPPTPFPTTYIDDTGEPIMNNIETKTFIRGAEASSMSDSDIFRLIAKLEGEVDTLGKIKVKSVKVAKAIADLNEDVQKLVEYLDSRP